MKMNISFPVEIDIPDCVITEIRNKAIDDFKTILMENCMAENVNKKVQKIIEIHEIFEIAEQLKVGDGE